MQQQHQVLVALRLVQSTMAQAMPHGRDYQFRPDEYPQARAAWLERMEMVKALYRELESHARNIAKKED